MTEENRKAFIEGNTVQDVEKELEMIKSLNCPILVTLAKQEIERIRGGIATSVDVVNNKKVKIRTHVKIPTDQYPSVNFIGKLLGPGARTLKQIQEESKTKMTINGIDQNRPNDQPPEKVSLHIDSLGTPVEAYYRMSHALSEIQKCLSINSGYAYENTGGKGRSRNSYSRQDNGTGANLGPVMTNDRNQFRMSPY